MAVGKFGLEILLSTSNISVYPLVVDLCLFSRDLVLMHISKTGCALDRGDQREGGHYLHRQHYRRGGFSMVSLKTDITQPD